MRSCRVVGCAQSVPLALTQEILCLDHFIEQAFAHLQAALELCQKSRPLEPRILDWLLADADFVLQSLAQNGNACTASQHDKLLELLLGLTNLQEYLRHHSVQVRLSD
jgi:hypothetical protein